MYETIWKAAAQITVPCPRMKSKTLHGFCCLGLAVGWAVIGGIETEARAAAGATTPFVTLEAEAGTLGAGAIIRSIAPGMPVPTVATLELEASGHSLVELRNNGDSVSWVNNTGVTANALVIRASIPDHRHDKLICGRSISPRDYAQFQTIVGLPRLPDQPR
jgi:hypothetical protein